MKERTVKNNNQEEKIKAIRNFLRHMGKVDKANSYRNTV